MFFFLRHRGGFSNDRPWRCRAAYCLFLILLTGQAARATKVAATNTALSPEVCQIAQLSQALIPFAQHQPAVLESVDWFSGGRTDDGKPASPLNPLLPAHCIVTGVIGAHIGAPGVTQYGNHFRLRIPMAWNGRFFFQGGGGNNGSVGNAIGTLKDGQNALTQGFAVVAQDSGHVGRSPSFALDHKAYLDFAYQGVHEVTLVSKAILKFYAGREPDYAYFVGCSNGGREAMVTAQRYADFDGVVAGDPGMAAYDQWVQNLSVLQTVSKVAGVAKGMVPTDTSGAYRDEQLSFVVAHFMQRCDPLDGVADGLISNYQSCKVMPADERELQCQADGGASTDARCLSSLQMAGLKEIYRGVVDVKGKVLYPGFAPGTVESGLREQYLGTPGSNFPLGSFYGSIMQNFYFMGYGFRGTPDLTGPADQLASYPTSSMAYVAQFDVLKTPALLDQGRLDFHGANSDPRRPGPNFENFRKRHGKMLIYTGTADSAVQASAVMALMDRLNAHYSPKITSTMARLFMVPGMNHCRGGATADQFDQLSPLVKWVEQGVAPEKIVASAVPGSVLDRVMPGITRPLCVYPRFAQYKGQGDPASAANFSCVKK